MSRFYEVDGRRYVLTAVNDLGNSMLLVHLSNVKHPSKTLMVRAPKVWFDGGAKLPKVVRREGDDKFMVMKRALMLKIRK